jgi:hypothetical protein
MAKEPLTVSGANLIAALDRASAIMKDTLRRDPDFGYVVAAGGLNDVPSIAIVFTFEPETMRHTTTKICSEKRAAKEWMKANGISL